MICWFAFYFEQSVFNAENDDPYTTLLAAYLNHSQKTVVDNVPMFSPCSGSDAMKTMRNAADSLINRLKTSGKSDRLDILHYMLKVYNLCIALWGPLETEVDCSHAEVIARKERLTYWLEEAALETNIVGLQEEEQVDYISDCPHLFGG